MSYLSEKMLLYEQIMRHHKKKKRSRMVIRHIEEKLEEIYKAFMSKYSTKTETQIF